MRKISIGPTIAKISSFKFYTSGWLATIFVMGISLVLLVNFGRVIANAGESYEVYQYEKVSMEELLGEHEELQQELEYYQSFEYKKLYARDNLHLAEPNEKLYRIVGETTYYDVARAEIDLFAKANLLDWWKRIIF